MMRIIVLVMMKKNDIGYDDPDQDERIFVIAMTMNMMMVITRLNFMMTIKLNSTGIAILKNQVVNITECKCLESLVTKCILKSVAINKNRFDLIYNS